MNNNESEPKPEADDYGSDDSSGGKSTTGEEKLKLRMN